MIAPGGVGQGIGRCRQPEADIGEGGDEIEQDAETDGERSQKPHIGEVGEHLPSGCVTGRRT